jgi:hypothetical protein
LLIAAIPLAMNQPDTGAIEGLITDELGPVPGAAIEAHQPVTGVFVHGESDATGYYRIDRLHSGHYSLWVQAAAHDSIWIAQVPVERGLIAREDIFVRRTRMVLPTGE